MHQIDSQMSPPDTDCLGKHPQVLGKIFWSSAPTNSCWRDQVVLPVAVPNAWGTFPWTTQLHVIFPALTPEFPTENTLGHVNVFIFFFILQCRANKIQRTNEWRNLATQHIHSPNVHSTNPLLPCTDVLQVWRSWHKNQCHQNMFSGTPGLFSDPELHQNCRRGTLLWHLSILATYDWTAQ